MALPTLTYTWLRYAQHHAAGHAAHSKMVHKIFYVTNTETNAVLMLLHLFKKNFNVCWLFLTNYSWYTQCILTILTIQFWYLRLLYVLYDIIYICLSIYIPVIPSLEHRASVKRFISLHFLNPRQSGGLLGRGISPSQGSYLHRTTRTQNKQTDIHALSGIRTYGPSVRAGEDISCFRPPGQCDWLMVL
jgi:hypothetical protein